MLTKSQRILLIVKYLFGTAFLSICLTFFILTVFSLFNIEIESSEMWVLNTGTPLINSSDVNSILFALFQFAIVAGVGYAVLKKSKAITKSISFVFILLLSLGFSVPNMVTYYKPHSYCDRLKRVAGELFEETEENIQALDQSPDILNVVSKIPPGFSAEIRPNDNETVMVVVTGKEGRCQEFIEVKKVFQLRNNN